jgi:hypothetical protein
VPGDDEHEKKTDVLFVGPRSDDGDGYKVLRHRDESLEVGEIRSTQEGKPIHGEVVKLTPREGQERIFDVDVVVPKKPARRSADDDAAPRKGPAQVATDAYRENWELIFAPRRPTPKLSN